MTDSNDYPEKRKTERLSFMADVRVTLGEQPVDGVMFDIGAGGAKVRLAMVGDDDLESSGDAVVLTIPKFGEFDGRVAWNDGKLVGIQFSENHKALVSLIRESIAADTA